MVLIALQSTLTVVLAILIVVGAVASCVHKRKPSKTPRDLDDDLQPLGIPVGENASELQRFSTRKGYFPTATNEQGDFVHRASTLYRDPYIPSQSPAPIYEEYSSSYGGSSRSYSIATRKPSMGHGRVGSLGHDSEFHYRPIGSPLGSPPAMETTPREYS